MMQYFNLSLKVDVCTQNVVCQKHIINQSIVNFSQNFKSCSCVDSIYNNVDSYIKSLIVRLC